MSGTQTLFCPHTPPPPPSPCDIPCGCCFFAGAWTVVRSPLRVLRRVAAFCRPLRPVLLRALFPRSRSAVIGCTGAVLVAAGAVCASAVPSSWRTGGGAGCCGGRLTVFAAHTPPLSGGPPPASPRFRVREAQVPPSSARCTPAPARPPPAGRVVPSVTSTCDTETICAQGPQQVCSSPRTESKYARATRGPLDPLCTTLARSDNPTVEARHGDEQPPPPPISPSRRKCTLPPPPPAPCARTAAVPKVQANQRPNAHPRALDKPRFARDTHDPLRDSEAGNSDVSRGRKSHQNRPHGVVMCGTCRYEQKHHRRHE